MNEKETLEEKAYRLWKAAGLPEFLNRFGPKKTPGWMTYLCHLEFTVHAPAWRRAAGFMADYYDETRHWTSWQKAIGKWSQWVWDALERASVESVECELSAVDGTSLSRSDPSQHYLKRIGREGSVARPIQAVILVDIVKRKFLSWRIRAKSRGEKCDVPYLIRKSPCLPQGILMDKGFDSNPLHAWLRDQGIWSVAPVRKGCKRGQYRQQLRDCFDWCLYWQRSIVEAMISAIKRLFGSHVRARTARMQRAEISTKFIAYNIGPIKTTFYRAVRV
jgi:hypothetical protein